jgi:endonuclease III
VKNAQESARSFLGLLKKITKAREPKPLEEGDPVSVMVMSFLIWDCTTAKANAAYKRIVDQIVDFNDLRVTMPHEIVEWIGPRYPRASERCQRLRAALRHAYKREHTVNLDRLRDMGRREVKHYLRSLDGISPYVADRVTLLCFDAHCIPVDERLHRALIRAGVGDESVEIQDMASWLSRQVKAADALVTHQALQAWADKVSSSSSSAVSKSGTKKKTTKKKTAATRRTRKK